MTAARDRQLAMTVKWDELINSGSVYKSLLVHNKAWVFGRYLAVIVMAAL